jgi:Restriction endonuclease
MAVNVHPDVLIKALAAIEPDAIVSLDHFQAASGILSRSVAKKVIDFLVANKIGSVSKSMIRFSGSDKLYMALLMLRMSCDIEEVSTCLSWKDFERLASEVLSSHGYRTRTNVRLTRPRMEIDVVGISADGLAIAVDCKHWKRSNPSSISIFSQKQAERTERLLKHDGTISQAVPVMLTLHAESVRFVGRIPLVPIHKFRSFIIDLRGFLPQIYVAGRK